ECCLDLLPKRGFCSTGKRTDGVRAERLLVLEWLAASGLSAAETCRAEGLFWRTLSHLMTLNKGFAGRRSMAMPRRFRRVVRTVDATTICLVANCMDCARHRRRT